jgi:negative regulator of sigma-B (phosphoserine phosphatase)
VEVDAATVIGAGRFGPIEWSVAARPLPGQFASGDEAVAVEVDGRAAVFGVIDGLGHGPDAASAAARAASVVGQHAAEPLDEVLGACHRELGSTRGAAMTLARIDFRADTVNWVGVGNVTAALVARAPSGVAATSFVRLVSGIVGFQMPRLPVPEVVDVRPGHLLVMASDGVTEDHLDGLDFAASADAIANRILGEHTRVTDDALVLVARHRGAT